MAKILLTNDDGHGSAGFIPLFRALERAHSVLALTPDAERSWIGKAISAKKELALGKVKKNGFTINTLSGTPADCVQVGIYNLLKSPPDMVVSGINLGSNATTARILSSGTVGAAMEAALAGVKSVCASLEIPKRIAKNTDFFSAKNHHIFEPAAEITARLVGILSDKNFGDEIDLFSVNIPFDATIDSKLELTRPHRGSYRALFRKEGQRFKHGERLHVPKDVGKGTDLSALERGSISVTPISLSLVTDKGLQAARRLILRNW